MAVGVLGGVTEDNGDAEVDVPALGDTLPGLKPLGEGLEMPVEGVDVATGVEGGADAWATGDAVTGASDPCKLSGGGR